MSKRRRRSNNNSRTQEIDKQKNLRNSKPGRRKTRKNPLLSTFSDKK
jgi:hypothetical protein